MKTKVMTITPAMANDMLQKCELLIENHLFSQRALARETVNLYAREMKQGNWLVTHQGIAIATDGAIIDGRHRLSAIVKSGCTVEMNVTTGIDRSMALTSNNTQYMDLVDMGRQRNIGTILQISHGLKNGKSYAALANSLCLFTDHMLGKLSVTQAMQIVEMFRKEIDLLDSATGNVMKIKSNALCILVLFASINQYEACKIASSLKSPVDIKKDSGCLNFVKMYNNEFVKAITRFSYMLYLANACKAQHENRTLQKLYATDAGREWLITGNKERMNKILSIIR